MIAELGLAIDSQPVAKARDEFGRFVAGAGAAQKAADGIASASDRMGAAFQKAAQATTQVQERIGRMVGGFDKVGKSARDSAAAFDEIARHKTTFDQLRASLDPLYASSMRYEQAVEQVQRAVQSGAVTQRQANRVLEQAEQAYLGAARNGPRALADQASAASGGMSRFAMQAQNASFQVQDFAVQVSMGTPPLRAFAQQFPQMAGGFGLWGAALGAAVAVAAGVAPVLMRLMDSAGDAGAALNDLRDAVDAYREAADLAFAPTEELVEQFGSLADEARTAYRFIAESRLEDALGRQQQAFSAITSELSDAFVALNSYERAQRRLAVFEGGNATAETIATQRQAFEQAKFFLNDMLDTFDLSVTQAQQLRDAVDQIEPGTQGAAAASQQLLNYLTEIYGTTGQIPDELRTAAVTLAESTAEAARLQGAVEKADQAAKGLAGTDIASGIGAGADEAARLAGNLFSAATAAASFAEQQARTAVPEAQLGFGRDSVGDPTLGSANLGFGSNPGGDTRRNVIDLTSRFREATSGGGGGRAGGGGAGGISEAQREMDQFVRTLEGFRTESQSAAADLAELETNFGRFQGQLTPEQIELYGQGIDELRDRLRGAGEEGESFFDIIESHMPRLSDLFRDGTNAVYDMARSIADMAFQLNVLEPLMESMRNGFGGGDSGGGGNWLSDFIGGLFPNAKGNAFDQGNVIPFARGGIVDRPVIFPMARGAGLMGEAGPEAIMPLRRGPSGKLGVEGSAANINMEVHVHEGAGGDQTRVQQSAGRIDIMTRDMMRGVVRSGGLDSAMRERFGVRAGSKGG